MQVKSLIRYPLDIRRARRLLASKDPLGESCVERPVVLDLRTPQLLFDCGRHLAAFAHFARTAGSPFFVRGTPLLLAGIARKIHGREMLAEPNMQWIDSGGDLPRDAFVLCDYRPEPQSRFRQMLIGRDIDRSGPVMPYPMHPATLRHAEPSQLVSLREAYTRAGILFAGNQKPKYGDIKMHRNFGVISRLDVLQTIAEAFPRRVVPSTAGPIHQARIVISDSRLESIDAIDWLSTLAKERFFICCPGACQPACHHLIEAMSVGTIPILEYSDRVTPPLIDGETAICFRGKAGLVSAIERIDQMSAEQLDRMRVNVARFYDQHLCGTKFLAALRDDRTESPCRPICMPFHERNFYDSDGASRRAA